MNQRAAPELESNEYLVVAIEKGVLTPWAFNRSGLASLSARSDDWLTTSQWSEKARELPRHIKWGEFGQGLVVVDMDHKKTYNLTDRFCLVHFNAPRYERLDNVRSGSYHAQKTYEHFLNEKEDPKTMLLSLSSQEHGMFTLTLDKLLEPLPQDEWKSALQVDEQGRLLNWPELSLHSFSIQHPGWEHDSPYIGQKPAFEVALSMLNHVKQLGVPWPSWKSLSKVGEDYERSVSHYLLDEDMPRRVTMTWEQLKQNMKKSWTFPANPTMYKVLEWTQTPPSLTARPPQPVEPPARRFPFPSLPFNR